MNVLAVAGFIVGTAILAALVGYAGVGPIVHAAASLGFAGLGLISLVHLPVVAFLGLAWFAVARHFQAARLWDFVWARLVRDAAGEVLPFSQLGGYAAGVRVLTLARMAVLPASAGTLADLIVELVGKLPYVLVGLICLAWLSAPAELVMPIVGGLTAAALLTALFFVVGFRGRGALERFALILSKRFPDFAAASMERLRSDFHALFGQRRALSAAFLLHFLCWLAGAFETWLLFRLMGISLGAAEAIVIDSLMSGLRTLAFFVPGAVGVQEASYALLGALFGVTPAAAIGFSLARRARDFLIGIPVLLAWNIQEGRRVLRAGPREMLQRGPLSEGPP
jgi:putative membrane protein